MKAEKLHSVALTIAKYLSLKYQGDDQIASHFVIFFGDELVIYSQHFSNLQEKLAFRNTACLIMKAFDATGYIVLNEAWALPSAVMEGLSREQFLAIQRKGIDTHPDRLEILSINGENNTHLLMANHNIHRSESGGIIGFEEAESSVPAIIDKSELANSEGIFANCLKVAAELQVPDFLMNATRSAFSSSRQKISDVEAQFALMIN